MQIMEVNSWAAFKSLIATKMIAIQYSEYAENYDLFAPEDQTFLWRIALLKDGGSDVVDFETNYKPTANSPLEIKSGTGRPTRVAASPQPINTLEQWKGAHLDMDGLTFAFLDISFPTDVYLKGGIVYAHECTDDDYVGGSILLKANDMIVKPNIVETVYLIPDKVLAFVSSECTFLPSYLKFRVTYETDGTTDHRSCSYVMNYFKLL